MLPLVWHSSAASVFNIEKLMLQLVGLLAQINEVEKEDWGVRWDLKTIYYFFFSSKRIECKKSWCVITNTHTLIHTIIFFLSTRILYKDIM